MKKYYAVVLFLLFSAFACRPREEQPRVIAIYPSSDLVPSNLLRIYIHFSHPMKTVGNLEKIKLLDADGEEIEHVFFQNAYELWNREQTQLTLIVDPARVKTGLLANETFGRVFKPDKTYELVVEGLEDVNHRPLRSVFRKTLIVQEADTLAPDLNAWEISIPESDSDQALKVKFPNMLDFNSLQRRLVITDHNNLPIKGTVSIEKQETEWVFLPEERWQLGKYTLYVNARLEDPSGNNLNGLFDHEIGSLKYEREGEILQLPFVIKESEEDQ